MTGRARGRGRGRGRGRDITTEAPRPTEDVSVGTVQVEAPSGEYEPGAPAPTAVMVPVSTEHIESAASGQASAESSTVAATAKPTAARSVASKTAAAPGAKGKKPLAFQPTFKGRRSQAERDAMKQEAWAKEQERKAEAESVQREAARLRGGFRGRGDRGGGRGGRGGYMGDAGASAGVAGPFSAGSVAADNRKFVQRQRVGGFGGGSSGIKKEGEIKTEHVDDEVLGIKREAQDYGYISSDPDENEGPRFNVDEIVNLVSSDEDTLSSGPASRASSAHPKGKKSKQAPQGLIPVRVFRKEHKERTMGINTEASSATAAEIQKQRDAGVEVSAEDAIATVASKGKGKARMSNDMETTTSKPYKGMWRDVDSDSDLKKEKSREDVEMLDVAVEDAADDTAVKEQPSSPELKKRAHRAKKVRRKSSSTRPRWDAKPALQTEEERQEWARIEADNDLIVSELRHTTMSTPAEGESGAAEGSEAQMQESPDQKADRVYLFQFPPLIPDLVQAPESIKKEPSSPTMTLREVPAIAAENPTANALPGATAPAETPIKIEEDADQAESVGPSLASGRAGKLQVHASGRVTLNWGGTSLCVHKGMDARFLQDVLMMNVFHKSERSGVNGKPPREGAYGGEAMSFGQIRGKFVVTPDWDEIVG